MIGKNAQVLHIEPSHQLIFKGPFNDVVTCQMRLTNPTDRRVCFKVKTTAPKQYCVRPNVGYVDPGSNSSVLVMLQPFDDTKNIELEQTNHKFLVQSVFAPPGDISLDNIWKSAQAFEVMDSKLMVVLEPVAAAPAAADDQVPPSRILQPQATIASGQTVDVERDVRRIVDEKKKAEAAKADLQRDCDQLKAHIASMEAMPKMLGNSHTEKGIAIVQVVLIAFAALLVGLILGKLF